eukprot:11041257-Alexandrium_andersonii.AAC.1
MRCKHIKRCGPLVVAPTVRPALPPSRLGALCAQPFLQRTRWDGIARSKARLHAQSVRLRKRGP